MPANEDFSLSFADGIAYCFYLQLFVLFPVWGLVVYSKIHHGHSTEQPHTHYKYNRTQEVFVVNKFIVYMNIYKTKLKAF